jgi:hypothetical protein
MSGEPYLNDVAIEPKLPSDGTTLTLTISWVKGPAWFAAPPGLVEIYALFGASSVDLTGHRINSFTVDASPIAVTLDASNRNPNLYVGVAPRITGEYAEMMPDASGELQTWESFMTTAGFQINYVAQPSSSPTAVPTLMASAHPKTLSGNDHIDAWVRGGGSDFNLRYGLKAPPSEQLGDANGNFSFDTIPEKFYLLTAQQRGHTNDGRDPWSPWSQPITLATPPRFRSLRRFLSASNVLAFGTKVAQYTRKTNDSVRRMMGL